MGAQAVALDDAFEVDWTCIGRALINCHKLSLEDALITVEQAYAYTLRDLYNFSARETATILNISVDEVNEHLTGARDTILAASDLVYLVYTLDQHIEPPPSEE